MPHILLCWKTTLEEDVGGMTVEVEPSCQQFVSFVAVRQIAAEEQSDRMASDMEVHTKQRCVIDFLHADKIAPVDIHRCLLNVYGDPKVNVGTVRRWVSAVSTAAQHSSRLDWISWNPAKPSILIITSRR
jgi:hypothetical protein